MQTRGLSGRKIPTIKPLAKTTPKKVEASTHQSAPAFVPFEVETSAVIAPSIPTGPKLPASSTFTTCEINYPSGVQLKLSDLNVTLLEKLLRLDV
ncbi:MAG TPA: hypothetical protein DCS93_11240 [Microscillaceae bacterium]|nr:hypothetical protein [Microscillaceae bacterium]